MPTGRVKCVNDSKDSGFIEQEGGEDVFGHFSSLNMEAFGTLTEGEPGEFEVKTGGRGLSVASVVQA